MGFLGSKGIGLTMWVSTRTNNHSKKQSNQSGSEVIQGHHREESSTPFVEVPYLRFAELVGHGKYIQTSSILCTQMVPLDPRVFCFWFKPLKHIQNKYQRETVQHLETLGEKKHHTSWFFHPKFETNDPPKKKNRTPRRKFPKGYLIFPVKFSKVPYKIYKVPYSRIIPVRFSG